MSELTKETILTLAIARRESGHFDEAATILRAWLVVDPQDSGAYALLAHIRSLNNQDHLAWHALRSALSLAPNATFVLRNHARLLLKQGQILPALSAAQEGYHREPAEPENQLVLAAALGAMGERESSLRLVNQALSARPGYAEAFAHRATLKERVNDLKGALVDVERALSLKPHRAPLWSFLAALHFRNQRLPAAIHALLRAWLHQPADMGHMINLGELYRQAGAVQCAINFFERAARIAPNIEGAWVGLGAAFQQVLRLAEAKVAYARALTINPLLAEVANNLGAIAKEEASWEEAIGYFKQAIDSRQDFVEAHYNLGTAQLALGNLEDAEGSCRRALILRPNYPEAENNLASSLQNQGNLSGAVSSLARASTLAPDFSESRMNLGKLLWDRGDISDALTHIGAASTLVNEGYTNESTAPIIRQESIIYNIIYYWIIGNYSIIEELLKSHQSIKFTNNKEAEIRLVFVNAYFKYMYNIIKYKIKYKIIYNKEKMLNIFVLGDSHSLSVSGISFIYQGGKRRGYSCLIPGIKMWHVGKPKNNYRQACLQEKINRIPLNADFLFCIGEIDCRWNEGIWNLYKKKGGILREIVFSTVSYYLGSLFSLVSVRCPASVTIQGIPAPQYPLSANFAVGEGAEFLSMIALVNKCLEEGALALGWNFLDVYSATRGEDGASHGRWELDGLHLQPGFYLQAERWLKRPPTMA